MLRGGGSFIDAALAAAAVLNVVEPFASHLGGDAFLLVHEGATGRTVAINGSGAAPLGVRAADFATGIPTRGLRAATVPGQVHAWQTAHRLWGRLPWQSLFDRAIELAETGFAASDEYAAAVEGTRDVHEQPGFSGQFRPGGRPVAAGQIVRMPAVARTLREIAAGGAEAYYEGAIADRIGADSRRLGGWFEPQDLARHETRILEPLRIGYPHLPRPTGPGTRGASPADPKRAELDRCPLTSPAGRSGAREWTIAEQPPPSQGFITLQALGISQALGLHELPFDDPQRVHGMIEAVRLAFADKDRYWADPERYRLPVRELLDPEYIRRRARLVRMDRAGAFAAGDIGAAGETTYLCAADETGNAVSFIQSIFYTFGSGVVVGDTGILLNNRMNGFVTRAGHVNEVSPGRRPVHTLNTYLVYDGPELRYVGGTPGGNKQVQWNVQVLSALLDHAMTVQQAAAAPRWAIDDDGTIRVERDYGDDVIEGLRRRGHRVRVVAPRTVGGKVQLLEVGRAGQAVAAACDPRCAGRSIVE